MPVREPGWWYGPQNVPENDHQKRWPAAALGPAAGVWAWAARRRQARAQPVRSALPVICVGNFTAGGTGKTPLSILIAQLLVRAGERPVFLTRGYGGRVRGPYRVMPSLDTAADVGDEPLLLSRYAPVIVARDRVAGARVAAADAGISPPTVIVMDDGLQNPGLAKDLTLAVVDGRRGLGNERVMPAGPLRAPLDMQLGLADAIVVNTPPGAGNTPGHYVAADLRQRFQGPVLEVTVEAVAEGLQLEGARVLALAGIANPARFYALLDALGADVVGRAEFADHHAFNESDASRVLEEARRLDARIVTTEKDWVRLVGRGGRLAELRERAETLPVRIALSPRDAERLSSLVEAALIRHRKGSVA